MSNKNKNGKNATNNGNATILENNKNDKQMSETNATPDATPETIATPDATPDAIELTPIQIAENAFTDAVEKFNAAKTQLRVICADETKTDAEIETAIKTKTDAEKLRNLAKLQLEKLQKSDEHNRKIAAITAQLNYLIDSDATEKQTDGYKTIFAEILEKLHRSIPLVVAIGTTGKQLEKQTIAANGTTATAPKPDSIRGQLFKLFDANATTDEILLAGFTKKQLNDSIWHWKRTPEQLAINPIV